MKRPMLWAAVIALVLLAAGLRVRGLAFGLPAVYNPDEVAIMSRSLAFATGDPNPHNFVYPTLYFYGLFAWIAAYFAGAWLTGAVPSAAAFQSSFFSDPTAIYLAGRALSVTCGVLAVLLTWRIGERLVDRTTGVSAATFLAVSPFAVLDAHYVKHDVPVTFALLLASLALARLTPLWKGERHPSHLTARLVLAGLVCGLATSVHYYAVFIGVPLLLAAWWSSEAAKLKTSITAAASAAVGFLMGSPFILVEPLTAYRDVAANRRIVVDRAIEGASGLFASGPAYVWMLAGPAMGSIVAALAIGGAVMLFARNWRLAVLWASFPAAFLLFISNTVPATRYLNPVLPFVALFAGVAVSAATSVFRRVGPGRAPAMATGVLVAVAAAGPLVASVRAGGFLREDDTRTLARRFIEGSVPAGAGVLVQPYSAPMATTRAALVEALRHHLGDERRASIKFQLQLSRTPWPAPAYRVLYLGTGGLDVDRLYFDYADLSGPDAVDRLLDNGIAVVVLKAGRSLSPAAEPLRARLSAGALLKALFTPYPAGTDPASVSAPEPFVHNTDARIVPGLVRPGPVLEVWELPARGARSEEAVE